MKKLSELENSQVVQIDRIRKWLRLLGCEQFNDMIGTEADWLESNFPFWEQREILPFILPKVMTELTSASCFVMDYYDLKTIIVNSEDSDFEGVVSCGYLMIACNFTGGRLVIDTKSSTGMDVIVLDYASLGSYGLVEDSKVRLDKTLEEFFRFVYENPDNSKQGGYNVW